ncbi:hypothetical protein LC087_06050 [Bacillus carboniphilus]|uniref:Uncharacterized protein n=1 Tax=Bacillus carboniphilus TaxID=86663 RepID=A0ABY9JWC8_9BACI|nr:hypothetical protein [Bacillus carboniphilus]WLR43699.1 hypothetical protein LC087_06050 [Bacillus carboniphilus]
MNQKMRVVLLMSQLEGKLTKIDHCLANKSSNRIDLLHVYVFERHSSFSAHLL